MKSYYFLPRSTTPKTNHRQRNIALSILAVAVLFAVVMHLPKPKPELVSLHPAKPQAAPKVVIPDIKSFTVDQKMPYGTTTIYSPSLPAGVSKVTTPGVFGIWTQTYQTTTINGKESPKRLVSITTTREATTEVLTVGTGQ